MFIRKSEQQVADALLPVILAGGAGTRLWPLSRELYPKQFLRLIGDATMLQHTLARLDGVEHAAPVIVCNHDHRFIVAEQSRQIDVRPSAIVLEPAARSTAPALALAALRAVQEGDPVLLALPADAYIGAVDAFHAALRRAATHAAQGAIVTFGVVPTRPETGYGYIRAGKPLAAGADAFEVEAFTEKPALRVAERYLAADGYFWNSGMFAVRASVYLQELQAFRPEIYAACASAMASEREDLDFLRPGRAFRDSPADSIDYAVMEHTKRAVVVPTHMDWTDLGSWSALSATLNQNEDGNTIDGDVIAVSTRDSHIAANDRLVAVLGMDRVVVVETSDAVLVAAKHRAHDVSAVVDELRRQSRSEHQAHTTVYRPWGRAETFKAGDGFLVKRIIVAPGEALSLQMHRHRAEHWVVVRGEATVERGDERFVVAADASTYIPVGVRHRLSNRGQTTLEVIEVQVGALLSEDDIVRFEDRYGRQ